MLAKKDLHMPYLLSRLIKQIAIILLLLLILISYHHAHADDPAPSPQIILVGIMGNQAIITINNGTPRTLSPGQTYQGIKLISVQGNQATVAITNTQGTTTQTTLRIGAAPITLEYTQTAPRSPTNTAQQTQQTPPAQTAQREGMIVLERSRNGHFYTDATINQQNIHFIVDTGADTITLSGDDAKRLRINYQNATPIQVQTANGINVAYSVKLASITIQGITIRNIRADVMPSMSGINLLGQNYLHLFHVETKNNTMTLKPRR